MRVNRDKKEEEEEEKEGGYTKFDGPTVKTSQNELINAKNKYIDAFDAMTGYEEFTDLETVSVDGLDGCYKLLKSLCQQLYEEGNSLLADYIAFTLKEEFNKEIAEGVRDSADVFAKFMAENGELIDATLGAGAAEAVGGSIIDQIKAKGGWVIASGRNEVSDVDYSDAGDDNPWNEKLAAILNQVMSDVVDGKECERLGDNPATLNEDVYEVKYINSKGEIQAKKPDYCFGKVYYDEDGNAIKTEKYYEIDKNNVKNPCSDKKANISETYHGDADSDDLWYYDKYYTLDAKGDLKLVKLYGGEVAMHINTESDVMLYEFGGTNDTYGGTGGKILTCQDVNIQENASYVYYATTKIYNENIKKDYNEKEYKEKYLNGREKDYNKDQYGGQLPKTLEGLENGTELLINVANTAVKELAYSRDCDAEKLKGELYYAVFTYSLGGYAASDFIIDAEANGMDIQRAYYSESLSAYPNGGNFDKARPVVADDKAQAVSEVCDVVLCTGDKLEKSISKAQLAVGEENAKKNPEKVHNYVIAGGHEKSRSSFSGFVAIDMLKNAYDYLNSH